MFVWLPLTGLLCPLRGPKYDRIETGQPWQSLDSREVRSSYPVCGPFGKDAGARGGGRSPNVIHSIGDDPQMVPHTEAFGMV